MTTLIKRATSIAAAGVLIGAAACGHSDRPMADDLKQDLAAVSGSGLELAPKASESQVVVSAIEAGQTSAPVRATRAPVVKPTIRPAPRVAMNTEVVAAPAPRPVPIIEAPETAPTSTRAAEPAPLPPMAPKPAQRQSGTYKTEAEVFRQMPWIKP